MTSLCFATNARPTSPKTRQSPVLFAMAYAVRHGGWLEQLSSHTYLFRYFGEVPDAARSLSFFIQTDRARIIPAHATFPACPSWTWLAEIICDEARHDLVGILSRLINGLKQRRIVP